jgi:hypothetical protein
MKHFSKTSGFRLSLIVAAFAAALYLTPANAVSVKTAPVNGLSYTFQTAPTRFIDVDGTRLTLSTDTYLNSFAPDVPKDAAALLAATQEPLFVHCLDDKVMLAA